MGPHRESPLARLEDAVIRCAARTPEALAVVTPGGGLGSSLSYRALDRLANRIARALAGRGVGVGDRVALWLEKSPATVAAMQAVLRLGAAYLPIDPRVPAGRCRTLLDDGQVTALVTDPRRATALDDLPTKMAVLRLTPRADTTTATAPDGSNDWAEVHAVSPDPLPPVEAGPDALAFILYTSGSTGRPKGVCLSHTNALAFVRWAHRELAVTADDRLANHAPFHFDLSVLDLYVAFESGASVHLIPDHLSFAAPNLVRLLAEERPTLWYSVPSVLLMMIEHGGLLELDDLPLRALLFAGESFPLAPLRRLRQRWPMLRMLNLYGPTETNVCTFQEVGEIAPERTRPIPIGKACCGDRVWARRDDGQTAGPGEEGELMVEGPTVMLGYWGAEPQGDEPYATGDQARVLDDGSFELLGRRDRMAKIRGHRIEPAEIEAALLEHPAVAHAAVVVAGQGLAARLVAFLVARPETKRPSLLVLKQHSAERLPRAMILDRHLWLDALPLTRNGKVDRRELETRAFEKLAG